jgi:hypothetical protein
MRFKEGQQLNELRDETNPLANRLSIYESGRSADGRMGKTFSIIDTFREILLRAGL